MNRRPAALALALAAFATLPVAAQEPADSIESRRSIARRKLESLHERMKAHRDYREFRAPRFKIEGFRSREPRIREFAFRQEELRRRLDDRLHEQHKQRIEQRDDLHRKLQDRMQDLQKRQRERSGELRRKLDERMGERELRKWHYPRYRRI
ncbi:MAG: hypothetical protein ACRENB_09270 [Gemmatimonadales bacterium]